MRLTRDQWTAMAAEGTLTEALVRAVRVDGYAIVESVFPAAKIAAWRSVFDDCLAAKLADTADLSRGNNRLNVKLPIAGPLADEELLHNPLVMPVVYEMMGPDPICTWFTSDTPLAGAEYQPAHADDRPLFPTVDAALPIYALVVNVPLVDCRPENSPMDIWPGGTHLITGMSPTVGTIGREPMSGLMPAGSLFIRDTRMWHRGTPNQSGEIRPLLSLVMSRFWFDFGELIADGPRLTIDSETYASFSPATQCLFRMADVPGGQTVQVRRDSMNRNLEASRLIKQMTEAKAPA